MGSEGRYGVRMLEIHDEWQKFIVNFRVYHPSLHKDERIRVLGDRTELGAWSSHLSSLAMVQSDVKYPYMLEKYGEEVAPYELSVKMDNSAVEGSGQPLHISYKYMITSGVREEEEVERDPSRLIEIHNPLLYKGQISLDLINNSHKSISQSWIINGCVERNDKNFFKNFTYSKVEGTDILIGSYPILETDVLKLQQEGVTAILNLQTVKDLGHRGYTWSKLVQLYEEKGIQKSMHYPIDDQDEAEYQTHVLTAAQYLNDLTKNQGHKVFIHCNSGISRSPTVLLAYMCLYKRARTWKSIDESE
mmetsp:Transcript_11457/g.19382  ORF Transcript_11457/g.19382 Transcript_11457/m.19382 type:complete len:304 (+) Transcript_11457:792-1703(+)